MAVAEIKGYEKKDVASCANGLKQAVKNKFGKTLQCRILQVNDGKHKGRLPKQDRTYATPVADPIIPEAPRDDEINDFEE